LDQHAPGGPKLKPEDVIVFVDGIDFLGTGPSLVSTATHCVIRRHHTFPRAYPQRVISREEHVSGKDKYKGKKLQLAAGFGHSIELQQDNQDAYLFLWEFARRKYAAA